MSWQTFKQRVSDSAIDFALGAFWLALWGAVVTGSAAVYLFFRGAPTHLLIALGSSALTLALVVVITAAIVFLQRRSKQQLMQARVGRKGFLDYKMQGQRALVRITSTLGSIARVIKAVGKDASIGARRTTRGQSGWFGSDERAYRAVVNSAKTLDQRATVMKLHADSYAVDTALFIEGFGKWIDWVVTKGGTDRDQREKVASMLESMSNAAREQIPSLEQFRSSVEGARESSEHMDLAGQGLVDAMTTIIDSTQKMITFSVDGVARLRS